MTDVDRHDNGRDEERDRYGHTEVEHEAAGACRRQSMDARVAASATEYLGGSDLAVAFERGWDAAHRRVTDDQRREQVARWLYEKVLERDRHPYADSWDGQEPHVKRGWYSWADELLAALRGQDGSEASSEPCRVYSHGRHGWHCSVEGPHEQHRNAAGDVTW